MIISPLLQLLHRLPFEIKGASENGTKQDGLVEETGGASRSPAASYSADLLKTWKAEFPHIDSSHFLPIMKLMASHALPMTRPTVSAIDSYLYGPPLAERVRRIFLQFPEEAFDAFPLLAEMRRNWEKILSGFRLEEISAFGKGGTPFDFLTFFDAPQRRETLLHAGRRYAPQVEEALQEIDLWTTAQKLLLTQNGGTAPVTYFLQLPLSYRKEDLPSYIEVTGRRKGNGINRENFSLYLTLSLPALGEMALRLHLVDHKAHLYLYSNREGEAILSLERKSIEEGMAQLGYRLGELRWLPLPKDEGKGEQPIQSKKPLDYRV